MTILLMKYCLVTSSCGFLVIFSELDSIRFSEVAKTMPNKNPFYCFIALKVLYKIFSFLGNHFQ